MDQEQNEPAASSTATAVEERSTQEVIDQMTEEERAAWQATGELPEPAKEKAETKVSDETPASEAGKEAETAKEPAPARSNAETRKAELGRDVQELLTRRAALANEVDELEGRKATAAVKPAEPAKEVTEETPPKMEDYTGEDAYDKYLEAKISHESRKRVREVLAEERTTREKSDREAREKAQLKEASDKWLSNIEAAEKAHPDFRQVALDKDVVSKIPPNSVLDIYVAESDHGREVLYVLAKNPDKLAAVLAHKQPLDQARAIFDVEREVLAQKAPASKVPGGPEPPASAGGPSAKPEDAEADALARGDFTAYKREADKRELAQSKRG